MVSNGVVVAHWTGWLAVGVMVQINLYKSRLMLHNKKTTGASTNETDDVVEMCMMAPVCVDPTVLQRYIPSLCNEAHVNAANAYRWVGLAGHQSLCTG